MFYPQISKITKHKNSITTFGGLNTNEVIASGELHEVYNMTCDDYPALSVRKKRGLVKTNIARTLSVQDEITCVKIFSDKMYVIMMNKLYVSTSISAGGTLNFSLVQSLSGTNDNRRIITFGSYIVVTPDFYYYNTADTTDKGYVGVNNSSTSVSYAPCKLDGSSYTNVTTSASEPKNPTNSAVWIDTSTTPTSYKQWSESASMWVTMATTYTKITATNIGKGVKEYDTVTLSGCSAISSADTRTKNEISALNGDQIVYGCGDNYIIICCVLNKATTNLTTSSVSVKMSVPEMDYVIESNNRLWGCKYGLVNGQMLNEIYASKLGDFRNWRNFMGLSTDSYTVSIGTEGAFTGAVNYMGYPLFFKADCIHKIYGSYPAQYQVQTTKCRGVKSGCSDSLEVINNILYYKSPIDFCSYDGSTPYGISNQIDSMGIKDVKASRCGSKMYCLCKSKYGSEILMVYDTKKGIWHIESIDKINALFSDSKMTALDGYDTDLYMAYLYNDTDGHYHYAFETVNGSNSREYIDTPDWELISDRFDYSYITTANYDYNLWQIKIRMYLPENQTVTVGIAYDDVAGFKQEKKFTSKKYGRYDLDILVRKCDHCRIRLIGNGSGAKIYGIDAIYEEGSEH